MIVRRREPSQGSRAELRTYLSGPLVERAGPLLSAARLPGALNPTIQHAEGRQSFDRSSHLCYALASSTGCIKGAGKLELTRACTSMTLVTTLGGLSEVRGE
jgi:hypothetical protein